MKLEKIYGTDYKVVDLKGSWLFAGTKDECILFMSMYKPQKKQIPTEVYNSLKKILYLYSSFELSENEAIEKIYLSIRN
jgi:hypothetical protein